MKDLWEPLPLSGLGTDLPKRVRPLLAPESL